MAQSAEEQAEAASWLSRIADERARRAELRAAGRPYEFAAVRMAAHSGSLRPQQFARVKGDADHWCDHCEGFFGVPHSHRPAPYICQYSATGCACIDCCVKRGEYLA